jgi:predicted ATPase
VLYERLAAVRRLRLHRYIGDWEEGAYGERVSDIAAELAMHFERGQDYERAVQYLTQAGQNALRRSAHPEAISLLTKGLELLMTLPETPERVQHEITLQSTLGTTLTVTKGYASPEVQHAHERAFVLCRQMGDLPQLFPVLAGLWGFRFLRAELHAAKELAAQLFRLAQPILDPALLLWAHTVQGLTLSTLGELPATLRHLEEGIALYDPQLHRPDRTKVGAQDPKMTCLSYAAWTLWRLGYPDQAQKRMDETLTFAQHLSHPFSLAFALDFAGAGVGMFLRDVSSVHTYTEMLMQLCYEQGFPYWLGWGTVRQGWVLVKQGQTEAGITKMHEGMSIVQSTGAELSLSYILAQLAEAYGKIRQEEKGLPLLAEALARMEKTGERWYEAELHRLKGQLVLQSEVRGLESKEENQKAKGKAQNAKVKSSPQLLALRTQEVEQEAEECFLRAIDIARRQQAKSLELRAVMSLVRLRKQQVVHRGSRNTRHDSRMKLDEAYQMLDEVYHWFTEGFDTPDLQEAKALLGELSE